MKQLEHQWVDWNGRLVCKLCGVLWRTDGPTYACSGPIKITTREEKNKEGGANES